MRAQTVQALARALKRIGEAHHEAFEATDGADPDWAIWYAARLRERLNELLSCRFTQTDVVILLAGADRELRSRDPDADWPTFYAEYIAERFLASDPDEKLALYHFDGCPFCRMVRRAIKELELDIELRDIHEQPRYRAELIAARGRSTVPVLQCTGADGTARWMPESRDIIEFLRERFGE